MKKEQKLVLAVVLLLGLVGGAYYVKQGKQKEAQAHSVSAAQELPKLALAKEQIEKVTRLVVSAKDKEEVVLEKKDDKWRLVKPLDAAASGSNVEAALKTLEKLEVAAVIADSPDDKIVEKYELDDKNATHVQAFAGDEKLIDAFFGKSGTRGHMMRLSDKPTVFAAKGFVSTSFARDVKGWRDTGLLKFEDGNAIAVEIENKKGKLSFTKADDKWKGAFYKRDDKSGKVAEKAAKWEKFDEAKVKEMLRNYKLLNATDFAKEGADTGLSDAVNEGGIVRVKFKDDNGNFVLKVGKKQEGENRYVEKEGDPTIYVLSSWAAEWATADLEKFSKSDEKKDDAGGDDGHGHGMPGMPEMPEMPGMEDE